MVRRRTALFVSLVALMALLPVAAAGANDSECGEAYTPIYEIQGAEDESGYHGDNVTTEGIVTVDYQEYGELGGYFIQDPAGDNDPKTSDGIYIDNWKLGVSVGDHVRVTGWVDEQYGQTQLEGISVRERCGTGTIEPTALKARQFTKDGESYEGMLVEFKKDLTVTDTYNLYKYGEIWLNENGVAEQPTNHHIQGAASGLAEKNMATSVLLDDGSANYWKFYYLDPPSHIPDGGTIRLGDTAHVVGAVGYAYGKYRIQPLGEVTFTERNAQPGAPSVAGDIVVGSANVLNYWTTLGGRGADDPDELAMQTDKLVAELLGLGADIIGLQEIENDPADVPITTLVAALNTADAVGDWTWIGELDYYNEYPIRNEIIYRSGSVTPVGDPMTLEHDAFDAVRTDPKYDDEPIGRPPVAQTFEVSGEVFTIVVNHLKSKGSPCDTVPGLDDPDTGDGAANCNLTRVWQAETTLGFVDFLVDTTGDPDVLVVGDMNAYLEEDPIRTFESELKNLVSRYDKDPYSYNYFASFSFPWVGRGLIDHAFATPSLAKQVTGAAVWHINADEPHLPSWDEDDSQVSPYEPRYFTPDEFGASDHDPVVVGLKLRKDA